MLPYQVDKPRNEEVDNIRNEFRPTRLRISEINGEYFIYRIVGKKPILVGKTQSIDELRRRCMALSK